MSECVTISICYNICILLIIIIIIIKREKNKKKTKKNKQNKKKYYFCYGIIGRGGILVVGEMRHKKPS